MSLKLGTRIDRLYKLRDEIRAKEKALKTLKAKFSKEEDAIFKGYKKQELDGAQGKVGKVTIKRTVVGNIKNYKTFTNWLMKHKHPELLQRRVSNVAYRELLDQRKGKLIPGMESFEKITLSLTKAR